MTNTKLSVLFALTIVVSCGLGFVARAEEVYDVDDFDPQEREKLEKLAPHLEKLNKILLEKLDEQQPQNLELPKEIMAAAEKELSSRGCLAFCFTSKSRKSLDKVIELLLELDQTFGRCDRESYNILTGNHVLHEALGFPSLDDIYTAKVLEHYRKEHATLCRPEHRKRFAAAIEKVPAESLERVERIFVTLTVHHFNLHRSPSMYHRFDLVGMRLPSFARDYSRQALNNIITQLKVEIGKAGEHLSGQTVDAKELRPLLDEHLFEPCQKYRNLLATILNEARFDAGVEDGAPQREFIYGDGRFYLALVTNRMCNSLLKDRDVMYETFAKAWTQNS